jgi:hypothetical protein
MIYLKNAFLSSTFKGLKVAKALSLLQGTGLRHR